MPAAFAPGVALTLNPVKAKGRLYELSLIPAGKGDGKKLGNPQAPSASTMDKVSFYFR
jgi:hypothetical protein